MNKKILGVKISSILTGVVCVIAAFAVWLFFNLHNKIDLSFVAQFVNHFNFR